MFRIMIELILGGNQKLSEDTQHYLMTIELNLRHYFMVM